MRLALLLGLAMLAHCDDEPETIHGPVYGGPLYGDDSVVSESLCRRAVPAQPVWCLEVQRPGRWACVRSLGTPEPGRATYQWRALCE